MHCLFTYGLNGPPDATAAVLARIQALMAQQQTFQALGCTYVLKLDSQSQWLGINGALQEIARTSSPVVVHFLMTPLMPGGRYGGWMPPDSWTRVNQITDT